MAQAAAPAPAPPRPDMVGLGDDEYESPVDSDGVDDAVDPYAAPPDPDKAPSPAKNLPGSLGKAYMNKDSVFDGQHAQKANLWSQRKGKAALAGGALLTLGSLGLPFTAYAAAWAWSARQSKRHPKGTPEHEKWASRQFAFAHPRQTSAAVGGVLDKLDTKRPRALVTFATILFGIPLIFSVGAGAGIVGLAFSALAAPVVGTAMIGRHFKIFRRTRLALKHRGVAGKAVKLQREWFENEFLEKGNQPPAPVVVKVGPHPSSPDHKNPTLESPAVAGPETPQTATPDSPGAAASQTEPETEHIRTTADDIVAPERRTPEKARPKVRKPSLPAAPTASHLRGMKVTPSQYQQMLFYGHQSSGMDTQFTYYQAELNEVARLLQEPNAGSRKNAMKEARRAVNAFDIDQPRDRATRELLGALYSIGYAGKGEPQMSNAEMADLAKRVSTRASRAISQGRRVSYHYAKALEGARQAQRAERAAVKAQQASAKGRGSGGVSL